jgi:hypothetical protein
MMRRALALLLAAGIAIACEDDDLVREETLSTALLNETNRRAIETGDCQDAVLPITSGFGSPGALGIRTLSFPNPDFPDLRVHVFLPRADGVRHPVILFAHANDVDDPDHYGSLLSHLASRGHAVIFSPYMIEIGRVEQRYDPLWSGFAEAVRRHRDELDLSRVGFVGHSFGAGALPWLAERALVGEGWGAEGAFLFAMAPWYALRMTDQRLARLPGHLKALVLVFEEDRVNDHRIAIDLYEALGVPDSEKDYLVVRPDRKGACVLSAPHTVPQSRGLRARDDALDVHAVYRLLDALAAYAFEGDERGREVALGKGAEAQVAMGHWRDGTPLVPLLWRETPEPSRPEESYLFKHRDAAEWRSYEEARPER